MWIYIAIPVCSALLVPAFHSVVTEQASDAHSPKPKRKILNPARPIRALHTHVVLRAKTKLAADIVSPVAPIKYAS